MSPIRELKVTRYRTNEEIDAGMQRYLVRKNELLLKRNALCDDIEARGLEKQPSMIDKKDGHTISFLGKEGEYSTVYNLQITKGERYFHGTRVGKHDKGYDWIRTIKDADLPLVVNEYMTEQAREEMRKRLKGESPELPVLNDFHKRYLSIRKKEDRLEQTFVAYRSLLTKVAIHNYGKGTREFNFIVLVHFFIGKNEYLFRDGVLVNPFYTKSVEAAVDLPRKKVLAKNLKK